MTLKTIEQDVPFLQKTIADLREEIDQLSVLHDMSRQMVSSHDVHHIINTFLQMVTETTECSCYLLYLLNEGSGSYQVARYDGVSERDIGKLQLDNEIVDWALKEGRCTNIFLQTSYASCDFVTILPLQGTQSTLGYCLIFSDSTTGLYNQANMKHLTFLSAQTGIALENQNLYSNLNRSKEYVHNILESINNGIITVDMADKIIQINKNATAMLGLPSADVVGAKYKGILPLPLAKAIDKAKKRIAQGCLAFDTEFQNISAGNDPISVGISFSPCVDNDGAHVGTIIVIRDMSASQELERLRELDVMKSEFVSNVSHELRSPLTGIKAYVEALLNQVGPDEHETQREFLTVVDRETDRLTALINDLLDISRIESGRFDLKLKPVPLSDIIQPVLKELEPRTVKHRMVVDIPSDLPTLPADRDKMIQVFLNLLDNAVKFSPEGGEISIKARPVGKMVKCDISDQGLGIAKKDIPHVFEKFYRVDNSDTYEIPGTGLGLPIVKHIVESHNGKISVRSKPGKGSVFTVHVPFENGGAEKNGKKDTGRR